MRSSRPGLSGTRTNMEHAHVGTKLYKSPLLRLPCELFVHAASYLSSEDLFSLRLTCRRAETFLFDAFSEEFFSDRRFMVTERLGCLINISKHPHLSKCLSKLTIGLDRLRSSRALSNIVVQDRDAGRPQVRGGIDADKLEELSVEQNWLASSGRLQLLLYEALNNLPNVVEICLRDANVAGDSSRPGSGSLRASYGVAEIFRETGVDFLGDDVRLLSQDHFVEIVFSAALLAVARSSKRLDAISADIQTSEVGLSSSAFAMPRSFLEYLKPTMHNLQSLDLSVSFTYVPLGSFAGGSNGFLQWQPHYLFLFLAHTPNLTCLRVRTKGQGFKDDGIVGWLAWLAALSNGEEAERSRFWGPLPRDFDRTTAAQRFRALRELELANMTAPTASLVKVLLYLAGSLRKLGLRTVGVLVTRTDDELDSNPRSPNAWASIFREISRSLDLEEMVVGYLGHHTPNCSTNGNRHQVAFLKSDTGRQSGPRNELLNTWSHTGSVSNMKNFLLEAADKTIIICTSCKQRNPSYRSYEDILEG
ncbi:hypothetical protein GGR54DRAFT_651775 [Hypoxylon sp. NC1633]|nr:hypothetical protein GGR54DRAFT_651775 [Hypoxylon sp. NC1633]